jgi:hypothetical protein
MQMLCIVRNLCVQIFSDLQVKCALVMFYRGRAKLKIFFVDDELSQNIPRIVKIFEGVLQRAQISDLNKLESSDFSATNDDVKRILERSGAMDVEYNFLGAVKKICGDDADYELLVVDRQLSRNGEYDVAAIHSIDGEFDEEKQVKYCEREGDYLLVRACRRNHSLAPNFYFLTAYSHDETIRSMAELQGLIDIKLFTRDQLIEKGVEVAEQRLSRIVTTCKATQLRRDLWPYLEGAEWLLTKKECEEDLIPYLQSNGKSLNEARPLVEGIVKSLCRRHGVSTDGSFWDMDRAVNDKGCFRKMELTAAKCVYDCCSMATHDGGENIPGDARMMVFCAVKTVLLRASWLRQQGSI